MKVTLLGPQRRPTLDTVAASLCPEGPVATITAGWQEREPDDGELGKLLGARDVNLRLYRRLLDVQERDPAFALGERKLAAALEELQRQFGEWVIDAHLPPPGTPTQPVAAGYMANAYVRMRHPDYDALRGMLDTVGRTLRVYAQ